MSGLAQRVVLSRTRVSRLVDELVRGGLLRKEPSPGDARSFTVTLTGAGKQAFDAAAPRYIEAIEDTVAQGMSTDELRSLAALLDRIASAPRGPEVRG